jgi:hypothetical protein
MTCCKEQNVTEGCLGICSAHQLDLDLLLYSPQCIPELDKLMTCGSGTVQRFYLRLRTISLVNKFWCYLPEKG